MTKQNGRCPLQQECERICKVVGHERHCDYYVNNRHGTSGIPDQDKILDEEDARKTREWEEKYSAVLDEDEETDGTEPTGDSKRMEPAAAVCEAETSGGGIKAALPAPFDYSGLDVQTVEVLHLAEREIRKARQVYICRVSAAVAAAHEAVVANCDDSKHGNRGEHAFINWCASVGLKKDAAYRLLQVNALLTGATPEEQATLEAASPSLLYAAARPSAPAELVQGVKTGDITTHKQYQELLAEIRTRDAKISELTEASGLVTGGTHTLFENGTDIPLTDHLFDHDSICLKGLTADTLSLVETGTGRGISVDITGFPYVLVWSVKGPVRFVCIEPWHGLPDSAGATGEWLEKLAALLPERGRRG